MFDSWWFVLGSCPVNVVRIVGTIACFGIVSGVSASAVRSCLCDVAAAPAFLDLRSVRNELETGTNN